MPDNHCCCDIPPPPPCTHLCIFEPAGCLIGWDYWIGFCTIGANLCRQGTNPCFTGTLNPPEPNPALPPAGNEICPVTFKLCFDGGWVLSWSFDGGQTWSSANFGGTLAGLSTGYCLEGTPLGALVCIGGMACPSTTCGICRSDKAFPSTWVVQADVGGGAGGPPPCATNADMCAWFSGAHVMQPYIGFGACSYIAVSPCCATVGTNFCCNLSCWSIVLSLAGGFVTFGAADPWGVGHVGMASYTYPFASGPAGCPLDCSQGVNLTFSLVGATLCGGGPVNEPCCNWPATIQVTGTP